MTSAWPRARARLAAGLLVLLAAASCTSVGGGTVTTTSSVVVTGADTAVAQFAAAWQAGQAPAIAALTTDPTSAGQMVASVITNLAPTSIGVTTGPISTPTSGTAAVTANFVWTMPKGISWKYQTSWTFRSAGSTWKVAWAPTVIHPQLASGDSLQLRTDAQSGGTIVDRDNQQLVSPVNVFSVVLLPAKVTDLNAVAASLEQILKPIDATVTAASVVAGAQKADKTAGYTVTNLREADYNAVKAQLAPIAGLAFPVSVRDLPATKDFAKVVLSQVEPIADKLVAGSPGWKIVSVDASGADLDTLANQAGTAGSNVQLTIDSQVQKAAEAALAAQPLPAVLVAIQPSTGEILAVAQNAAANAQGAIALKGEYPPGSTFKIVTATAGMDAGVVTPDSQVDCPGEVTIDGQSIHNEGFELGTVNLTQAFAKSCNTTFAKLSTQLTPDALTKAGYEYGVGRDFVVQGITTLNGKVPTADSDGAKAENGFGQGTVLVTPFGQALMAATAAVGNMPTPILIRGTKTTVDQPAPARSAAVQAGIKTMMRAVVTDGTATILGDDGEVYAKTGTADYSDSTGAHAHAWTVGFRGDVAFAVLIVGGDSSKNSNLIADSFLKAIPAG